MNREFCNGAGITTRLAAALLVSLSVIVLQVSYGRVISITSLSGALLVVLGVFYCLERSALALIYLVAWFNYLILFLSLLITNDNPSYLSTDVFKPWYAEVLAREVVFWLSLGLLALRTRDSGSEGSVERARAAQPLGSPTLFTLLSILVLSAELLISFRRYFSGYTTDSDVGTPLSEVGAMLFALVVFFRGSWLPARRRWVILDIIVLLLILVIAAGSGKRLALSFVAIAFVSTLRSKGTAFLAYFGFVFLGYVHGIIRDSFAAGGLSLASLIDGVFFTNQGGALHASAVYLRLVEEGVISSFDRVLALFSTFVGTLILPVSILPPIAQLNLVAMPYYRVQGNGGFIGTYSTVYLGLFGPLLFAMAFAALARSRRRLLVLVFALAVLATIRWTMYNVAPLVRLSSYVLLLIYCVYLVRSVALSAGLRFRIGHTRST